MQVQSPFIELDLRGGGKAALRRCQIAAVIENSDGSSTVMMMTGAKIDVTQSYDQIGHRSYWVDM